MNNIIHKLKDALFLRLRKRSILTPRCQTQGCWKAQWQNGLCRECSQYMMQEKLFRALEEKNALMSDISSGLTRLEEVMTTSDRGESSLPNAASNPFIPLVEIKGQARMNKMETEVVKRDLREIAQKLRATQDDHDKGQK